MLLQSRSKGKSGWNPEQPPLPCLCFGASVGTPAATRFQNLWMEEYGRFCLFYRGETVISFVIYCSFGHLVERAFLVVKMINSKKTEWAINSLRQKYEELGRLPKKSDFDVVTLSRIKAFLGPWPRALEAAGLKEEKKKLR